MVEVKQYVSLYFFFIHANHVNMCPAEKQMSIIIYVLHSYHKAFPHCFIDSINIHKTKCSFDHITCHPSV